MARAGASAGEGVPGWRGARVVALAAIALGALTPATAATSAAAATPTAASPAHMVYHGSRDKRVVALTFDDGWGLSQCRHILRTLIAEDAKATFFPNAVYVRNAPHFWRRVAESGFPIGNHTYDHPDLTGLSARAVASQIRRDETAVERVIGRPMIKVLRPPYGAWDATVARVAGSLGYGTMLDWDVPSGDDQGASAAGIRRNALRGGRGSVVLMHCGPSATPGVLADVIAGYRARGFHFVTVPELLAGRRSG